MMMIGLVSEEKINWVLSLPSKRSKVREEVQRFYKGSWKNKFCVSFTAISSYSFEAKGLKFGLEISLN